MEKYSGKIAKKSLWQIATPMPWMLKLPFWVTEAGHFWVNEEYSVKRKMHDSFLLLYTVRGNGLVRVQGNPVSLQAGQAIILDCHHPHQYASMSDCWEFLWIHFHGTYATDILEMIYPQQVHAITVDAESFEHRICCLIDQIADVSMLNGLEISASMHEVLNLMKKCQMEGERWKPKKGHEDDIEAAIAFMKQHYASPITVEDMIRDLHISKYHFIRLFRKKVGVSPYHYLTNHRMNQAKLLLCTTDKSVGTIAAECGFVSTSNFIVQFKKKTNLKPLEYRQTFT